jgi:hypothetical protein
MQVLKFLQIFAARLAQQLGLLAGLAQLALVAEKGIESKGACLGRRAAVFAGPITNEFLLSPPKCCYLGVLLVTFLAEIFCLAGVAIANVDARRTLVASLT